MNNIKWLENWYAANCNGDWEHQFGIKLDTLDNPGWTIAIDLTDTRYQGMAMQPLVQQRSDDDWIHCTIADAQFQGIGGPGNLDELLSTFREIIQAHDEISAGSSSPA